MDENRENDVLMMELPEYEEEFSPFAEVETQEISFAVNKEEIYKRNRLIAAEEKMKQLDEAEKAKEDKRTEMENIYTEASQSRTIGLTKKNFWIIVAASVLSLLLVVMAANMITAPEKEIAEDTAVVQKITYAVATEPVEAEVAEKKTQTEEAITTISLSEAAFPPLEADNGQTVYADGKISVMAEMKTVRSIYYYPKNRRITQNAHYEDRVMFIDYTVKNVSGTPFYFNPENMCIHSSDEIISPGYKGIDGSAAGTWDEFLLESGMSTEFSAAYIISVKQMRGITGFIYKNSSDEEQTMYDFIFDDESFVNAVEEKLEIIGNDAEAITVVREPLEETDGTTVYNTDAISYRFAVRYEKNEYGVTMMIIDVTAKNMTDYGYLILPGNFYLSANGDRDYYFEESNYNEALTYFTSRSRTDDEEEWREGSPIAFAFDEDNLCSFTLTGYISEEGGFDSFGFESDKGWSSNYEPVESFEIPINSMTAP